FQTHRFDLECLGMMAGVTVRLTPWGLHAFLGDAVGAVAEIRADCGDLFPLAAVRELEDRLFDLKSPSARASCVENFLLARLRDQPMDELARAACLKLAHSGGALPIKTLTRNFGLSERTLVRRFQNAIGTTPKKYARILRLRDAVHLHSKLSSWTEIAYAAGYCDQSHLIRDCQDIYGASPETLFPIRRRDDTDAAEQSREAELIASRLVIER
ncbi:MAG: AraC family transcriptional regulator, partial [Methylococcus sp.]|nr:AraC family transcriptional regulator [Methylococcus sp.]